MIFPPILHQRKDIHMAQKNVTRDMTQGSPLKLILTFSLPLLGGCNTILLTRELAAKTEEGNTPQTVATPDGRYEVTVTGGWTEDSEQLENPQALRVIHTRRDMVVIVLAESKEEIVSTPEIKVTQIEKGKAFIYEATVALKPEVTLGEYKGVEVKKAEAVVTDEDVENELTAARKKNGRLIVCEYRNNNKTPHWHYV